MTGKNFLWIIAVIVVLLPVVGILNQLGVRLALIDTTGDACIRAADEYGSLFGGGTGSLADAQSAAAEVFRGNEKLPEGSSITLRVEDSDVGHTLICRGTARIRIFPFLPEMEIGSTAVAGVR
jgi:hypothetical protein